MDQLVAQALETARVRGATYADIRVVRTEQERYVVRNGVVDTLSMDQSMGFGVRVVADGAWGFASSRDYHRRRSGPGGCAGGAGGSRFSAGIPGHPISQPKREGRGEAW